MDRLTRQYAHCGDIKYYCLIDDFGRNLYYDHNGFVKVEVEVLKALIERCGTFEDFIEEIKERF